MTAVQLLGRRWGVYCRISGRQGVRTGDDDDNTISLDTQESGCREMIARLDPSGAIVEPLVLREVHTGIELFSRPKLTRLREAMRRGEIDAIACYQPKRWARDPEHAGYLKTELREYRVALRFALDDPGEGEAGDLLSYVQHWSGKQEHKSINEQTHRARAKLVHLGQAWAASKAPYGLRWRYQTTQHPDGRITQDRVGWQTDPVEAAVLVELYTRAAGGASMRGLAFDLSARGVPSPTGLPRWTDKTVRYLLTQVVYTGEAYGLRHQRDTSRAGTGQRGKRAGRPTRRDLIRPEEEWVKLPDGYAPRIIEPALFEAVRAALTGRKAGGSAPSPTAEQTLMGGGRARCGECGNTMTRLGSRRLTLTCGGRVMKKCVSRPSIRMAALDDAARRLAYELYEHPERIIEQAEQNRATDPTVADLAMVEATLADIEQKQAGLALVASQITNVAAAAPLVAQLERLAEQKATAERDRARIRERQAGWEQASAYLDGFLQAARRVRGHLDRATHAEWQKAIDALGMEARVYPAAAVERLRFRTRFGEHAVCLERSAPASTAHEPHLTLIWPAAQILAFPAPPPTARQAAG
jgi:DNA invertase Pin-like site-specific DNA recombinase